MPLAEISDPKNDYNLNLPRYIDSTEPEDAQDIEAHLRGGIPDRDVDDLRRYWQICPAPKARLFSPADRPGYSQLTMDNYQLTIKNHPEFGAYMQTIHDLFACWKEKNTPRLRSIKVGDRPKRLIGTLAEDLLATFADAPLIDKYDVYQHLMTYWADTMQDDVYILVAEGGWQAGGRLRLIEEDKKEEADLKIGKLKYKADLIPPARSCRVDSSRCASTIKQWTGDSLLVLRDDGEQVGAVASRIPPVTTGAGIKTMGINCYGVPIPARPRARG